MNINNVLFVSPMYKELEAIVNRKEGVENKQFRFISEDKVSAEDYLWADVFVSFKRPGNFDFGNIKWVHSLGAGVDKLLRDAPWKDDVLLTRTISSFGQKISEYCLSYLLRDVQNHYTYDHQKQNKEWKMVAPIPLNEKKAVVFGTGVIGQEVARTLSFFGVKVYGISLSGTSKEYFTEVFLSNSDYHHVLQDTDYLINTMPLTEDTKLMIDEEVLHSCNDVLFINVGRGESVKNQALIHSLAKGHVKWAILDVFQEEPLPESDLFWTHPKVTVTPHISAITTAEEGIDCFLETFDKLEQNEVLLNKVDLAKGF
ncbi:D-2-hydroxyacid dehydrogenase [Salipaludibacillus daqingensis]|uniref:D-2-hydroxyacid dehydrogenase n=1 Tax=Salipaludibacillus daqingensis TaxID=3041001 RepID=UPI002474FF2F|nr:D-2-hydroxyacid dehydrogenase [Salipaludibacillus daqingensis]